MPDGLIASVILIATFIAIGAIDAFRTRRSRAGSFREFAAASGWVRRGRWEVERQQEGERVRVELLRGRNPSAVRISISDLPESIQVERSALRGLRLKTGDEALDVDGTLRGDEATVIAVIGRARSELGALVRRAGWIGNGWLSCSVEDPRLASASGIAEVVDEMIAAAHAVREAAADVPGSLLAVVEGAFPADLRRRALALLEERFAERPETALARTHAAALRGDGALTIAEPAGVDGALSVADKK